MREILFRGVSTDSVEWVEGWFEMYPFSRWPLKETIIPAQEAKDGYFHHVEVIPETVGQFTGLTDKNGTKIFEGDIVRVERDLYSGENKKERETFNGVVWYDEKHTCFGLKSKKYRCLPIHRFKGDYSTVIGNIHDNPELLEVE